MSGTQASLRQQQHSQLRQETLTINNGVSDQDGEMPTTTPDKVLKQRSKDWGLDMTDVRYALKMDQHDPLRGFRDKFHYPLMKHLPESRFFLVLEEQ